jgi:hypothetical protein
MKTIAVTFLYILAAMAAFTTLWWSLTSAPPSLFVGLPGAIFWSNSPRAEWSWLHFIEDLAIAVYFTYQFVKCRDDPDGFLRQNAITQSV